jgi:transposase InsO family protein
MKTASIVAACKSLPFRQCRDTIGVSYREWRCARLTGTYPPPERRGNSRTNDLDRYLIEIIKSKPHLSVQAIALACACSISTAHGRLKEKHLSLLWQRLKFAGVELHELNPDLSKARKHHLKVDGPGALVHIDAKRYCALEGGILIVGMTLVDNFSGFTWTVLCPDGRKTAEASLAALTEFRMRFPCKIRRLYSDNGSEFVNHAMEAHCFQEGIEFRQTKVGHPWSNGKVERTQALLKREVFLPMLASQKFASVAEVQKDLDNRLVWYNHERPHFGRINQGLSPAVVAEACCGQSEDQLQVTLAGLRAAMRAKNREQWDRQASYDATRE